MPSTALPGTKFWLLLAVAGRLRARLVTPPVVPVPERLTVRVGLVALLFTVNVPVLAPAEVGLKVTLTVQEAPAAMELPQVLVWPNWLAAVMEETEAATLPVLAMVIACAGLVAPTLTDPKLWLVGEAVRVAEPGVTPVPETLTDSAGLVALLFTVTVPVLAPVEVGLNVTLDDARRARGQGAAAVVGLAELARGGDRGDGRGGRARVGDGDGLGRAGRAHVDLAEAQARGGGGEGGRAGGDAGAGDVDSTVPGWWRCCSRSRCRSWPRPRSG